MTPLIFLVLSAIIFVLLTWWAVRMRHSLRASFFLSSLAFLALCCVGLGAWALHGVAKGGEIVQINYNAAFAKHASRHIPHERDLP